MNTSKFTAIILATLLMMVGLLTMVTAESIEVKGSNDANVNLHKKSSGPALGSMNLYGNDQTGAKLKYAQIEARTDSITTGSESSIIRLYAMIGGSLVPIMDVDGNGITVSSGSLKIGDYTLPTASPGNNQVLKTDGTGVLGWSTQTGDSDTLDGLDSTDFHQDGDAISVDTVNTGQGAYEVYAMNQNVRTTDNPTFNQINTGLGLTEVYPQNQYLRTTDNATFNQINTGLGSTEVYPMNQYVRTTDTPSFAKINTGYGATDVYLMNQHVRTSDSPSFSGLTVDSTTLKVDSSANKVGIGTLTPGGVLHIRHAGDEMLRLEDTHSAGNPYMSFYQNGTRRSYIQHVDSNDDLKLVSEYGSITLYSGASGSKEIAVEVLGNGDTSILGDSDSKTDYFCYFDASDKVIFLQNKQTTNQAGWGGLCKNLCSWWRIIHGTLCR